MRYLFDTDALSLLIQRRPLVSYTSWVASLHRRQQYTSAVVVGEMLKGAYRQPDRPELLRYVDKIIPSLNILAYDAGVARTYGQLCATLELAGQRLEDSDLQIAATAVHHELILVTGNVKHFARVPGLQIEPVIVKAREESRKAT